VFTALRAKADADAWDRVPATDATRALFGLAEKARLHPRHDLTQVRSRGRYGIVLDGEGADALFGGMAPTPCSRHSNSLSKLVGRTGFEPVTFSVSRKEFLTRCLPCRAMRCAHGNMR
jgi:asparagine synthetase B (glutamine-hydrolysing)